MQDKQSLADAASGTALYGFTLQETLGYEAILSKEGQELLQQAKGMEVG